MRGRGRFEALEQRGDSALRAPNKASPILDLSLFKVSDFGQPGRHSQLTEKEELLKTEVHFDI